MRVRRRPTRGFTVVEVMLALALSAMVMVAAISLYQVLQVSDRNSQRRFEQAADRAVSQITLRKIMNSLLAAPAAEPNTLPNRAAGEPSTGDLENEGAEESGSEEDRPEDTEAPIQAVAQAGSGPMFDLWWENYENGGRGIMLPVVELVVTEPPVELRTAAERIDEEKLGDVDESLAEEALRRTNRLAESVRGRLEVVGADDGWRLYWRPIDPVAQPFMLLSGIATVTPESRFNECGLPEGSPNLCWQVLSRDEKVEEWGTTCTAKLRAEFPIAVRLMAVDEHGRLTDWLFETHVSVPE